MQWARFQRSEEDNLLERNLVRREYIFRLQEADLRRHEARLSRQQRKLNMRQAKLDIREARLMRVRPQHMTKNNMLSMIGTHRRSIMLLSG